MPETAAKTDIRTLSSEALGSYFSAQKQPAFRSRQVEEWLWKRAARSFEEMTNLPKGLRDQLNTDFTIHPLETATTQRSADGTIKSAFRLHDGHLIEGVLIPTSSRMTACISSQVGCSLTCKFCATGRLKRLRNLEAAEIFDQVVTIRQQAESHYGQALSNIVYMGMGEPLLNYKNVLESVDRICSENGLGMSAKRITVSTAGIAKMIRRLGDDQVAFHLALSLHAANDRKRNTIMPINEQNTLDSLADALRYFHGKTGQKVTYEYIIFKNFNDSLHDAKELLRFCQHVPCKVNIIEYNPIDGGEFAQANPEKVDAFADYLQSRHITVNVRRSRGKDIDAACGQLANVPERDAPEAQAAMS